MALKKCKYFPLLILMLLISAALLPRHAAAAEAIDPQQPVSLTVTFRSGEVPLADLPFRLYLVATVDPCGELTVTEDFSLFRVDIRGENDAAWRALASTLEGYVAQSPIAPIDEGCTDENGQIFFPQRTAQLSQGLYFIPGLRYVQDDYIYEVEPFMVLLPSAVDDQWVYDLSVQPKYSQPEDKPMMCHVIKVWNDDGNEAARPAQIVVQLLCNGEVYDTVTLSAANDWRYTWSELSGHARWTVTEQVPENYTVTITREGNCFIVTNTGEPPEPGAELPQTGQLWWPVPLLALAGLALLCAGVRRRRGERHE